MRHADRLLSWLDTEFMSQPSVLTIREAEAALNLSGPRIHQLLASGDLEGPELPLGRKRHSPGVPRVSRESIARYLDEVSRGEGGGAPARRHSGATRSSTRESGSAEVSVDSSRAAAQELKVKFDVMRGALRAERARSKELLDLIEKLVGMLRSSHVSADQLDDVTEGYSQALTQLLVPDAPPGG